MSQKLGKAKRLQQARAAKCGETFTTQDVTGHDIEVRHSGMTYTEFFNHMRLMSDTNSRPRNDKDATGPATAAPYAVTMIALRCCRGWSYRSIWRSWARNPIQTDVALTV